MSFIVRFFVASVVLLSALPASADTLGIASGYNVFVFGNMTLSNTDVEGRAAVGGNATFSSFGVGQSVAANAGQLNLVVGGNAGLTNGQIFNGSGHAATSTLTGVGLNTPGAAFTNGGASPVDFAAADVALTGLSDSLQALGTTGSFLSQPWGEWDLTGANAALNVFSIDGSLLSTLNTFKIVAPTSSTIVINVSGAYASLANMGMFLNGSQNTDWSRVIWNFYDATAIKASSVGWGGSILAPDANIMFSNGQINGQVIANSINSTGEFHNVAFAGTLPDSRSDTTPVPEPTSIVLLGLGLSGLSVRGRRWLRRR